MHWLLLLLAIGALAVALMTSSVGLAAACVVAALVLLVAWVLGWYSARVGARSTNVDHRRECRKASITCATPSSSTGGHTKSATASTRSCAFATATP